MHLPCLRYCINRHQFSYQEDGKLFFHTMGAHVFYPVRWLYSASSSNFGFFMLQLILQSRFFLLQINEESTIVQGKIGYMLWDEALTQFCCFHIV
jgi:hypothetical protein